MKSLVDDETPSSVCTERAKRCTSKSIAKREKTRRSSSSFAGKKREHITAALFFYFTCCVPFLNERFAKTVLPHKNLESSSHMPLFSIYYYEC